MDKWKQKADEFIRRCNGKRSQSGSRSRSRSCSRCDNQSRSRSRSCSLCSSWSRSSSRSYWSDSSRSRYSRSRSTSASRSCTRSRSRSVVSRRSSRSTSRENNLTEKILCSETVEEPSTDLLDLSKDLVPLSTLVHDKDLLLREAVKTIGGDNLAQMIPMGLKELSLDDLEDECLDLLEALDTEALLQVLNGSRPEKNEDQDSEQSDTQVNNDDDENVHSQESRKKRPKRKHKSKHKKKSKKRRKKKIENSDDEDHPVKPYTVEDALFTDTEMIEKSRIIESQPALQDSLMELLEMEMRTKALKALLLSQGLDASNINKALVTEDYDRSSSTKQQKQSQDQNSFTENSSVWVKSRISKNRNSTRDETSISMHQETTTVSEIIPPLNNNNDKLPVAVIPKSSHGSLRTYRSNTTKSLISLSPISEDEYAIEENLLTLSDEDKLLDLGEGHDETSDSDSDNEDRRRNWRQERVIPQVDDTDAIETENEVDEIKESSPDPDPDRDSPVEYLTCFASPINHLFDENSNSSEIIYTTLRDEEPDQKLNDSGVRHDNNIVSENENSNKTNQELEPKIPSTESENQEIDVTADLGVQENEDEINTDEVLEETSHPNKDIQAETTWYERWFQSHKTQKALKNSKLQKRLRNKLKAEKIQNKESLAAESSTVVASEEPGEQIIGSIEEYNKLFGKNVKPITPGVDLEEGSSRLDTKGNNEAENSDDEDLELWGCILGSEDDEAT